MRITALGSLVIGATDVAAWRHFATEVLGLQAFDDPSGALCLKMDERHHRYLVLPHDENRLLASVWELPDETSFLSARERLLLSGVAVDDGSAAERALHRVQALCSGTDPSGNRVSLSWGPRSDFERFVSPIGVPGFVTGDMGMGHVVLPAPRFDETVAFWEQVLGFEVSDFVHYDMGAGQPPVRIRFLHCNNPRQHSVALVEMANPAYCDHVLVEVPSIDEVGRALYRAEDHAVPLQVTLGRHINDDMISFYMHSPGGFTVEVGAGGRRIEDWSRHQVFEATRGSHWGHRFVAGHRQL